ncbi:CDP-glycerol glycerophosphotransferase family protein [Terrabacter sp. AAH1]
MEQDVVLYEAFAGKGMLCNPEAIFRELLADPSAQHLRHVWVLTHPRRMTTVVNEFADNPRVRFVRYKSSAYYRALATAGMLVNNATFPPEFNKRPEQVYVNTWHGTPLKRMGFDEPSGANATRNVVRNFLMADYLLSSGTYMTEQMYAGGYRLANLYDGRILEFGQPRTDRQFLDDGMKDTLRHRLAAAGVRVTGRVVIYAPTWRGTSFYTPDNDALLLAERVEQLRRQLPDDVTVLLKVHQQVYDFARGHAQIRRFLVPNEIPTNVVLGLADVLVTDFSSIFFDFLPTGRPIIFFTPEGDDYVDSRGVYLPMETLPGPIASSVPELARLISLVGSDSPERPEATHAELYSAARERFAAREDGTVTRRVLDVVRNRAQDGDGVVEMRRDGREKVLIFLGGMRSNGITSSGINLLANFDFDRYDVTAVFDNPRGADRRRNVAALDPRVRPLARVGSFSPSKRHRRKRRELLTKGTRMNKRDFDSMMSLVREEWQRCFGGATFDHIVDFSGYSPFWAFLLSVGQARTHSIWLHNDLRADQMRLVDGRRPHMRNLGTVFTAYDRYDHLVSVSHALRDVNAGKLSEFGTPEKFTWAPNTIDYRRVLHMAHGDPDGAESLTAHPLLTSLANGEIDLQDDETVANLRTAEQLESIKGELERLISIGRFVPAAPDTTTFVTVGRLSPEKAQDRLLRAFDIVHQRNPKTRLVLVGDGPLRRPLERLAQELGLGEAVTFTGLQRNPFAILAHADAFVLSSDYEGQPMVILEARVLGVPVISTAFDSVGGALPEGVGLVVPKDHEALADAMTRAVEGTVPNPVFDPEEYNQAAIDRFYVATGIAAQQRGQA